MESIRRSANRFYVKDIYAVRFTLITLFTLAFKNEIFRSTDRSRFLQYFTTVRFALTLSLFYLICFYR
jgi:hypothetical protein